MNDTHPDIERVQIELLRQMNQARRAQLTSQLSNQVRWRVMNAIARTHPDLSETERKLLFIEISYGRELASRVIDHLRGRAA